MMIKKAYMNLTEMQGRLTRCLRDKYPAKEDFRLDHIKVISEKPRRRCLIEYDGHLDNRPIAIMGKRKERKLDRETYLVNTALWEKGFAADCPDKICVPEPIGLIADLNMWLYDKVLGKSTWEALAQDRDLHIAKRIARAAHKIHQCDVTVDRQHLIEDELFILYERLFALIKRRPQWQRRLERLLKMCSEVAMVFPPLQLTGIHRDYYPDQVLVSGEYLYILDFDLYCQGDPSLDIGNFMAHLTEYGLRILGNPDALLEVEQTIKDEYLSCTGLDMAEHIEAYKWLTLVRHISISAQIEERQPYTESILELCEQRVNKIGRIG